MRTALISDIHGSYERLQAVLADIAGQACDRIVCLGDLVDGEEEGAAVARLLRDRDILTVRGNHDESALADPGLPPDVRAYFAALPEDLIEGDVFYTHSSPRTRRRKVRDEWEAWNVFDETPWRRIFVGDVHLPLIFGLDPARRFEAVAFPVEYDREFAFHAGMRYLVCVGAVGYSRDSDPRARYAIFDAAHDRVSFRAIG